MTDAERDAMLNQLARYESEKTLLAFFDKLRKLPKTFEDGEPAYPVQIKVEVAFSRKPFGAPSFTCTGGVDARESGGSNGFHGGTDDMTRNLLNLIAAVRLISALQGSEIIDRIDTLKSIPAPSSTSNQG